MNLQHQILFLLLVSCGVVGCAVPVVEIPPSKFAQEEVVPTPVPPPPSAQTINENTQPQDGSTNLGSSDKTAEAASPNPGSDVTELKQIEDKNPFPTKYLNLNSPEKLAIALPEKLSYSGCSGAFSVWSLDRDGFVLNVEKDTHVNMTFKGDGGLYSEETCSKKLNRLTISKGTSDKKFWFRPGANFKEGSVVISSQDLKGEEKLIRIQPAQN